jgi:uncharacterized membrane protein
VIRRIRDARICYRDAPWSAASYQSNAIRNLDPEREFAFGGTRPPQEEADLPYDVPVRSTAQIAGQPIHPMLVPVPIVCFIGALLTDIAYLVSEEIMWANFSAWLLIVGLIFGVLAAIAGLIDFLGNRLVRAQTPAWPHLVGNAVVLLLAFFNAMIHTRDAWTSVWPVGLILSIVTVLILPVTGWLGWAMVYRHGVGVAR